MKLIVISSEDHEVNETLCVTQMFRAGLERFHLRKPRGSEDEVRAFLQRIPDEFLNRIVLHDHYVLLQEFALLGAHYNRRNAEDWAKVPVDMHRSISCHSIKELHALPAEAYQYAFFSPVFPSLSKEGYVPIYNLEEIQAAVQSAPVPVIALGGISSQTLKRCADMGFSGAAVLGSVWHSTDPFEAFHTLCKACPKAELPY